MSTKEHIFQRTTITNVRGSQLPEGWAKKAGISLDQEVDVMIAPPRQRRLQDLRKLMDRVSDKAEKRGLTEKKLQELLKDDG